jgi:2-polyprenyl-3-methyl-5-hydroxy-6-metoxy-1,4-benzoquinol methylase
MHAKKMSTNALPTGFSNPIALPSDEAQHQAWQQQNREWWQKNSMRYDWKAPIPYPEFSSEFYDEIDRRFFSSVERYAPWKAIPFDSFIDFDALKSKDVLEIGCGNGSHAQLLASHAKSYTGIDLTEYAVKSTSTRLALRGLKATVQQMDAEQMQFADNSFDFIWSWGVIHHSANTSTILKEMKRVLRPGGRAKIMVYHRGFWNYYTFGSLGSLMRGKFPTAARVHESIQLGTDGGLARFYGPGEWRNSVAGLFRVKDITIFGQKESLVPLPGGRVKTTVLRMIPNGVSRFFSTQCRMGNFLVSEMERA